MLKLSYYVLVIIGSHLNVLLPILFYQLYNCFLKSGYLNFAFQIHVNMQIRIFSKQHKSGLQLTSDL